MSKKFDRDQYTFLPRNVADLIPPDELVFRIAELIEIFDLNQICKKYSNLGQNGYHPKMLLSVLIYAYTQGIFFSRKIEEQIKQTNIICLEISAELAGEALKHWPVIGQPLVVPDFPQSRRILLNRRKIRVGNANRFLKRFNIINGFLVAFAIRYRCVDMVHL